MDKRALFEMETHTFCPAREHQEYPNRDGKRKWNKWKKIAIFIEVFLSKTRVNIGVTLPIQDMMLCNATTSTEYPLTTTGVDYFFYSYQLLYTLTTHAGSDNQEKKNMITEMNVIHEKR